MSKKKTKPKKLTAKERREKVAEFFEKFQGLCRKYGVTDVEKASIDFGDGFSDAYFMMGDLDDKWIADTQEWEVGPFVLSYSKRVWPKWRKV